MFKIGQTAMIKLSLVKYQDPGMIHILICLSQIKQFSGKYFFLKDTMKVYFCKAFYLVLDYALNRLF